MSGRRGVPNPARREPMLPAGLVLGVYLASTAVVGVFGGAAVSALLNGHGFALVPPASMVTTLERLVRHSADPAAAWPREPRPGPAWLTWLCIMAAAIAWCSALAIAAAEIDHHFRNRRRDEGLATGPDLRRTGLDARSASWKAGLEYPKLVARQRVFRHWRRH
ncbi:hypothetical protein [Nocardia terpenica]|uniref:hypothetical protein n=1 Tax=Nocardia terpenica TaxID=455432 RepID=UPI0012FDEFBA|nr:hypothetical protein [Nocardia terpenica]